LVPVVSHVGNRIGNAESNNVRLNLELPPAIVVSSVLNREASLFHLVPLSLFADPQFLGEFEDLASCFPDELPTFRSIVGIVSVT
jgi:hypothetical protein